jgi:lathosterol oxidase
MMQHPRYLKGQVWLEIKCSLNAFRASGSSRIDPCSPRRSLAQYHDAAMVSCRRARPFAHVQLGRRRALRGRSRRLGVHGFYVRAVTSSTESELTDTHSAAFFLVFTDFCIYWVHRLEHHPSIYRHLHKRHHKWVST